MGETVLAGRSGQVAGGRAGLDVGDPLLWIDAHPLHARKIDHEGVVDDGVEGQAVTAAPYRQRDVLLAGKGHGQ